MKKENNSLYPKITKEERKKIKKISKEAFLHYKKVEQNIKCSGRKKLRFAAYVVYASSYGMDSVFKLMMEDTLHWDSKIVIIPDVLRGKKNEVDTYVATKNYFVEKYGESYVVDGYDIDKDKYYDLLDDFDIVYFANPYDCMVNKVHSIEYASTRNVLPVYVSYGYDVGQYTTLGRLLGPELNLVWKCFSDTRFSYQDYKKYQIIKGKNVYLSGYAKMDELDKVNRCSNKERKRILICPHHTVNAEVLPLSNFLKYSDFILELPKLYSNVDFVFRPHPLLFTNLINNNIWDSDQVEKYLNELSELGVEYSTESDYMHLYEDCDAIVNDCGSFTVEWLFTGKPGCFVYSDQLSEDKLTKLMRKAIKRHYIARNKKDIMSFIDRVINEDSRERKLTRWVKQNIAIGYPNVSKKIIREMNIL
ncbi:hypothetical protein SAMN05216351_1075 [Pseudobutyrivibrio sp. JW11]|uniref:hypothetical protein n=1 Tax=Pseudobutyrivibrio sp. JW11 TaxID=1855302 RepID=UPI0008E4F8A2|nr:hypothetical protein [Pseudobutyrivibrio sp. JW11]SFO34218.1 hypothetical protein SAMN05216351_1075 [Pseudobutyrivibrio sp. JW11]